MRRSDRKQKKPDQAGERPLVEVETQRHRIELGAQIITYVNALGYPIIPVSDHIRIKQRSGKTITLRSVPDAIPPFLVIHPPFGTLIALSPFKPPHPQSREEAGFFAAIVERGGLGYRVANMDDVENAFQGAQHAIEAQVRRVLAELEKIEPKKIWTSGRR